MLIVISDFQTYCQTFIIREKIHILTLRYMLEVLTHCMKNIVEKLVGNMVSAVYQIIL